MIEDLLTRQETARRSRCCTRTLDRAVIRGHIEYIQIGDRRLFTEAARLAWVDRNNRRPWTIRASSEAHAVPAASL
jgi:hypothetical protein